jgi:hypothetical protein
VYGQRRTGQSSDKSVHIHLPPSPGHVTQGVRGPRIPVAAVAFDG